jgi:hypothetical protein
MREKGKEKGDEAYDNPHHRHVVFHSLLPKTSQNSTLPFLSHCPSHSLSFTTLFLFFFFFFVPPLLSLKLA